ncbi:MAG TPA: hypothetical protein VEB64_17705, partial [Azospirillaceae bacterium]|nr:hypothetical protein [Azospirillaceae bacterium]
PTPRVEFKLSPDLLTPFTAGLSPEAVALLGEGMPGRIAIEGHQVFYNGVPLNGVTEADTVVLCK